MENSSAAVSSSDPLVEDLLMRFRERCSNLLGPLVTEKAQALLSRAVHLGKVKITTDDEKYWFSSFSFLALLQVSGNSTVPATLNITDIINFFEIPLVDFVNSLLMVTEAVKVESSQLDQVKEIEHQLTLLCLIYQKYKEICSQNGPDNPVLFKFGWVLFLVTKQHMTIKHDLINLFSLLINVAHFVFFKNPPNTNAPELSRFCVNYNATPALTLSIESSTFRPNLDRLCLTKVLVASQSNSFLDENALQNIERLEQCYRSYRETTRARSFDEITFLDFTQKIGTTSRLSQSYSQYFNMKDGNQSSANPSSITAPLPMSDQPPVSPFRSPSTRIVPLTPITCALSCMNWLDQFIADQPEGPSAALRSIFESCSQNPEADILNRLADFKQKVQIIGEGEEARSRHSKLDRLYFKVLEKIIVSEQDRLRTQFDFFVLLSNNTFHCSLYCCALEIVLYCYQSDPSSLSKILSTFEIEPFEVCKVLDSFTRNLGRTPTPLNRHLVRIEESILEQKAWLSGSFIFSILRDQTQQKTLYTNLQSRHSSSAAGLMSPGGAMSPGPDRLRGTTVTISGISGVMSPGPLRPQGSRSLELFYKKLCTLSFKRAQELCLHLEIAIVPQICKTLLQILVFSHMLLENRHLDQIIMCTVYGACKASKIEISFKKIIEVYRQHSKNSSMDIWRSIKLVGEEVGDIIKFYNEVFVPLAESYLVANVPSSTNPSFTPIGPNSPLSKANNISVSPLQKRIARPTQTTTISIESSPSRRIEPPAQHLSGLYSESPLHKVSVFRFGSSPMADLNRINSRINQSPSHNQGHVQNQNASPSMMLFGNNDVNTSRSKKRLSFDDEDDSSSPFSAPSSAPSDNSSDPPPSKRPKIEEEAFHFEDDPLSSGSDFIPPPPPVPSQSSDPSKVTF